MKLWSSFGDSGTQGKRKAEILNKLYRKKVVGRWSVRVYMAFYDHNTRNTLMNKENFMKSTTRHEKDLWRSVGGRSVVGRSVGRWSIGGR